MLPTRSLLPHIKRKVVRITSIVRTTFRLIQVLTKSKNSYHELSWWHSCHTASGPYILQAQNYISDIPMVAIVVSERFSLCVNGPCMQDLGRIVIGFV